MDAGCAAQGGYTYNAPAGQSVSSSQTGNAAALVNPSASNFAMHDHVYPSANVPDANRAWALYTYNNPAVVTSLRVIEHVNGVDELEGFAGDSESTLVSVGRVVGSLGWGNAAEGSSNVFTWPNPRAGKLFKVVIRHTPLSNGYALYRMLPTAFLSTSADGLRALADAKAKADVRCFHGLLESFCFSC